jgi:hypothetical protein
MSAFPGFAEHDAAQAMRPEMVAELKQRHRLEPATDDECDELYLLCVLCWTGHLPMQLRGEASDRQSDKKLRAAVDGMVQVGLWPELANEDETRKPT